ncbi:MAG: DUF3857 domain-containing protein [Acidobacteria bacterium]|nr:DUF3857 domain-containing protein [Acidobacteriota bacterium]
MLRYLRVPRRIALCLFVALAASAAAAARAYSSSDNDWKPVDPAQLSMKTPLVERDADAEAIFWEVRADDGDEEDFVLTNYIRIKIFTDRGRESQSKVEIPFLNGVKIKDVAARTIKPDGTIVELKKEDVFEKTVVKAGGLKLRAKSFALQGVEPGAIIEYRWREVYSNASADYTRLEFQREIPVESITYHIKPSKIIVGARAMRFQTFHMDAPRFEKEKDGFFVTTVENVPAFREEPRMPPEDQVRRWILLYYSADEKPQPAEFWKRVGRNLAENTKDRIKANDDVKKAAAEIVGGAQTPEQKLERLYDYCRLKIKNLSSDAAGLTSDEREKLKSTGKPADTLKRGQGTAGDVGELFAALANGAGFDARVAVMADRSRIFFDPKFADSYFIRLVCVAVKVGDDWRFYDPSETYLPAGMLPWQEEMEDALVADAKEPFFVKTPLSPPDRSVERRTARLRLLEDGTLEGDVKIEYTGHLGNDKKNYNDDDSPQQREDTLKSAVKSRLSTAELSDIKIENVTDPVKPFTYSFKVRVPGYAQRTGKRLFVQPAFFEHGVAPLFATSDRQNMIYFNYPWSEEDDVEIALPEGFALDNADAPTPFQAQDVSKYDVKIGVTGDGRKLSYHRTFFFGGGAGLLFPAQSYPQIKAVFDELNKRDNHTITLKQAAAATASNPN